MAITITQSEELKIETYFVDGDTRTITIKNPTEDVTSTQIANLNTMIQKNNLLVGDKTGATFGKITKATRVTKAVGNFNGETITP